MHPKPAWSAETDPLHTRTPLDLLGQLAQVPPTPRSKRERDKAKARRKMAKQSRRHNRTP